MLPRLFVNAVHVQELRTGAVGQQEWHDGIDRYLPGAAGPVAQQETPRFRRSPDVCWTWLRMNAWRSLPRSPHSLAGVVNMSAKILPRLAPVKAWVVSRTSSDGNGSRGVSVDRGRIDDHKIAHSSEVHPMFVLAPVTHQSLLFSKWNQIFKHTMTAAPARGQASVRTDASRAH